MHNFQNDLQMLGMDNYQVGELIPIDFQIQDQRQFGGMMCGGMMCGGMRCGGMMCGGMRCGGMMCGGFQFRCFSCFNCWGGWRW